MIQTFRVLVALLFAVVGLVIGAWSIVERGFVPGLCVLVFLECIAALIVPDN
jgi:hypothetical protein